MGTQQGKKNIKYWDIIHWDIASFTSRQGGYGSCIYNNVIQPSIVRDLLMLIRGIIGGIIRFLQEIIQSFKKGIQEDIYHKELYLMLITLGSEKYASEESEIIAACQKKGIDILIIYNDNFCRVSTTGKSVVLPLLSVCRKRDIAVALVRWFVIVIHESYNFSSNDRKKRSLFVASIPFIRQYIIYTVIARQIVSIFGNPFIALNLCTFAGWSSAIISYLKERQVLSAGIRTQATTWDIENLATNTDILFCKSLHERIIYEKQFAGEGPFIENACLMQLPVKYYGEPLSLPEKYVLVLGTTPHIDQKFNDYKHINNRLFTVAKSSHLPIVFKGHNLSENLDDKWFAEQGIYRSEILRFKDIHHNRELIDRATFIVSPYTSMLYYALLCNKPIVIVSKENNHDIVDEFHLSPITRIAFDQPIENLKVNWANLQASCDIIKSWFESNYYIEKGSDYIVEYLIELAKKQKQTPI